MSRVWDAVKRSGELNDSMTMELIDLNHCVIYANDLKNQNFGSKPIVLYRGRNTVLMLNTLHVVIFGI